LTTGGIAMSMGSLPSWAMRDITQLESGMTMTVSRQNIHMLCPSPHGVAATSPELVIVSSAQII